MIKRLKIKDFRSIAELDLALDPITILVGRSGTGKSNVVHSLRFLRNLLLNADNAINSEGGWLRIIPVGNKSCNASIEVTFSVPGEDEDYVYGFRYGNAQSNSNPLLFAEFLSFGSTMLFDRQRDTRTFQWNWPTAPAIAVTPGHSESLLLGSFPSLQRIVFAYAALSAGIGYYNFPSTTLTSQTLAETWKNVPGLWDTAGNYKETMRAITQDFHRPTLRKNLLATVKAVNPSIVSIELDSLTNPQRAIVGHTASGRVFDLALEQESDGLRRFYAHLLAMYQTPAKLTLIFEEPENAIFPGALSILADEFKAAPRENRGQVILTTHSPGLLDEFDVANIRVVDMQDGKTIVGPVAKDQRDAIHDHLLSTGELLTVETPKLEPVNGAGPTP